MPLSLGLRRHRADTAWSYSAHGAIIQRVVGVVAQQRRTLGGVLDSFCGKLIDLGWKTFQVSDVDITTSRMRHLTLLHSIISFFYNTIIVALTINVILSLKGA